jgi:hypothetical protein
MDEESKEGDEDSTASLLLGEEELRALLLNHELLEGLDLVHQAAPVPSTTTLQDDTLFPVPLPATAYAHPPTLGYEEDDVESDGLLLAGCLLPDGNEGGEEGLRLCKLSDNICVASRLPRVQANPAAAAPVDGATVDESSPWEIVYLDRALRRLDAVRTPYFTAPLMGCSRAYHALNRDRERKRERERERVKEREKKRLREIPRKTKDMPTLSWPPTFEKRCTLACAPSRKGTGRWARPSCCSSAVVTRDSPGSCSKAGYPWATA